MLVSLFILSLKLLILEDQTELAPSFPRQVTHARPPESPPDLSLVFVHTSVFMLELFVAPSLWVYLACCVHFLPQWLSI